MIQSILKVAKNFVFILIFGVACGGPFDKEYPQSLTLLIQNPTNIDLTDELVEIEISALKDKAADFNPQAFIVLNKMIELPSQVNDIDGDGEPDKLVFLTDLAASADQKISIRYASEGSKQRDYKKRTQAELSVKFGGAFNNRVYQGGQFKNVNELHVPPEHTDHSFYIRYEGPGWESDKVGYRFYLDWRNANDIFGKKTDQMVLQNVGLDGFDSYHEMADWGADILKVGETLGIGSVAMWYENKAMRVAQTDSVYCAIRSNGPVQSQISTYYYGWQVGGITNDLQVNLSISAGKRLTLCDVTASENPPNICTGLAKDNSAPVFVSDNPQGWNYLANWGKQSLADDSLGMAILFEQASLIEVTEDAINDVIVLKPQNGNVRYYFLAAWQQEPQGVKSLKEFKEYLQETVTKLNNPVQIIEIQKG